MECPGENCEKLVTAAVIVGFSAVFAVIVLLTYIIEKMGYSDVRRCFCLAKEIKYSKELQLSQKRYRQRWPPVKNENIFHLWKCSCPQTLKRLEEILSKANEEARCQSTDLSLMITFKETDFDNAISNSTAVMDYLDEHHYMYNFADTSDSDLCSITVLILCDCKDSAV